MLVRSFAAGAVTWKTQVTKALDSRNASFPHYGFPCKSGRSITKVLGTNLLPYFVPTFLCFSIILKALANAHGLHLLPDFIRGWSAVENPPEPSPRGQSVKIFY
jgi:hypothetical protein